MKKLYLILSLVLVLLLLSGCNNLGALSLAIEPDEISLVRTLGVEKSGGEYLVTVCTASGQTRNPEIYSAKGETFSLAVNNIMNLPQGREARFSHTEQVIIGEKLAQSGIDEVLDYIERSDSMRLDTDFYICRGITPEELIKASTGENISISDSLSYLRENIGSLGGGYIFTCLDFASGLGQNGCALVQTIYGKELLTEGETELFPAPGTFALFNGTRLEGYLTENEMRGAIILLEKENTQELPLGIAEGVVTVKLQSPELKLSAEKGRLIITVKVKGDIASVSGVNSVREDELRERIDREVCSEMYGYVKAALDRIGSSKLDFAGLEHRAEIMGQRLNGTEPEIYVEAVIERTYDIIDPLPENGRSLRP